MVNFHVWLSYSLILADIWESNHTVVIMEYQFLKTLLAGDLDWFLVDGFAMTN